MLVPIEQIVVPEGRYRKDMGDVEALANSIADVGLLHPIVVSPDFRLIAGGRRLTALQFLGHKEVPVTIVSNLEEATARLLAERDENTCRLDLLPGEAVAIGKELERLERFAAKERQGRPGQLRSGKFPEHTKGQSRDKTGHGVGFSGKTYEKAKAVYEAAECDERCKPFLEEMNRTRKVDRAYKKLKNLQQLEALTAVAASLPPADERYQLHHADFSEFCDLLQDESIDAIITDPPYPKEFLPLYGRLAEVAAFLLKPGGSLVVMAGQSYLPEIIAAMAQHLTYRWTLAYLTPGGQSPQIWDRKVNTFWKPVLWFTRGDYQGEWIGDVVNSNVNDNDKTFHHWGQSESGMKRLVERFTKPGDTILDPFLGGGTTGVVAARLQRLFIGIDCDEQALETARARIALAAKEAAPDSTIASTRSEPEGDL